jgi:hypothetical protein
MPNTIEDIRRRAREQGMSVSQYLRSAVQLADLPTIAELSHRIRARPRLKGSSAAIIRRHRDAS